MEIPESYWENHHQNWRKMEKEIIHKAINELKDLQSH